MTPFCSVVLDGATSFVYSLGYDTVFWSREPPYFWFFSMLPACEHIKSLGALGTYTLKGLIQCSLESLFQHSSWYVVIYWIIPRDVCNRYNLFNSFKYVNILLKVVWKTSINYILKNNKFDYLVYLAKAWVFIYVMAIVQWLLIFYMWNSICLMSGYLKDDKYAMAGNILSCWCFFMMCSKCLLFCIPVWDCLVV